MAKKLKIKKNWFFTSLKIFHRKSNNTAKHFPKLFEAAERSPYTIPGLSKVLSLDKNQQLEFCTAMTPQGLTFTEEYLLISAYCHEHMHHSVIYVLDRFSGIKIKTVILPDFPHASGLAYDPIHRKLWISNTHRNYAAIAVIPLADLIQHKTKLAPIGYQQKIVLKDLPRASLLSYDKGYLYVGLFSLKDKGQFACYPIDTKGNLRQTTTKNFVESPYKNLTLLQKIQGLAVYQQYVIFSQSWGPQAGKLFIFDIHLTKDFSNLKEAVKIISTPPYLEQIWVEDHYLYALFESGAAHYRTKTPFIMDEVLQIDLKKLLKP